MVDKGRRGVVAKLANSVRRIALIVPVALIAKVDKWRRHQHDVPNLSEAVRRLIEKGMAADEPKKPKEPKP
jgi:hypothetical protein